MSMQTIDVGAIANDGTGDALRAAFNKINQNFAEIFASIVFTAGGLAILRNWSTGVAYKVNQLVIHDSGIYRCLLDHGSGVFSADLAAGKWELAVALPQGLPGNDGSNGKTVRSGIGVPDDSIGVDGDYYIDAAVYFIYGPKAAGAWPAGIKLAAPQYGGTSATSVAIGTGAKAFTTQAGLAYLNGARVRASSNADGTKWMEGVITYSGTALTITSDKTNGAGTFADWNFNLVGQPGAGDLASANNLSDLSAKNTGFDNLSVHGADVASATSTNLETATGNLVDITGSTAITSIVLADGHERCVRFTGSLTLTNGASLVLPGGANIVTAAGDYAIFRGYAAGVVRCAHYLRVAGRPLNSGVADILAAGFSATSFSLGTVSSGTSTPNPANGNFQHMTANGAFTLAPPSAVCCIEVEVLNGASAGAITTSGFTKVNGDPYATTNGLKFIFHIVKTNSYSRLSIEALQ